MRLVCPRSLPQLAEGSNEQRGWHISLLLLHIICIYYKLLRPVRPLQLDLVKDWTAETHRRNMQPSNQRPAAPYTACAINSNAINSTGLSHSGLQALWLRHCRPTCRTKVIFWKMSFFVVRVCTLRAKFHHRMMRHLGGDRPQTK